MNVEALVVTNCLRSDAKEVASKKENGIDRCAASKPALAAHKYNSSKPQLRVKLAMCFSTIS